MSYRFVGQQAAMVVVDGEEMRVNPGDVVDDAAFTVHAQLDWMRARGEFEHVEEQEPAEPAEAPAGAGKEE